jgi:hypothetical protein
MSKRSARPAVVGLTLLVAIAVTCGLIGFAIGSSAGTATARTEALADASDPIASIAVTPEPVEPMVPGDATELKRRLAAPPMGGTLVSTAGLDSVPPIDAPLLDIKAEVSETWVDTDAVEVTTQLVQFDRTSGPGGLIATEDQAFGTDAKVTMRFTIPGLDGCYGYDESGLDPAGNHRATLDCADESMAIVMTFFTPGHLDEASEIPLLQRQIDALSR